jgi:hypothetical protein
MHAQRVIIPKMNPMKVETMNVIKIPSGGCHGRDAKTISGHEKLQIAK